ncbi:HTH luxR-type domain-containing protein [Rubrivivax sp. A210]|uniref:helix-turn-helix transcriptional regulator n=1 Tax=Rubrivivax sp. A210 TaxID=2772301 RepID=UPI00191918A5|nr:LuxR C-terminal-related transcriptional regulator [Rubrivivax sp. A210]CAD5373230.1 HTH luxR-type domain-containing protein [Rubrivivax sp. A210]
MPAERRPAEPGLGAWLARVLDEVEQALLLLGPDGGVLHLNRAAREQIDAHHPLQLQDGWLRLRRPQDVAPLFDALAAAHRGQRQQLQVGAGERRIAVSLLPLGPAPGAVLMLLPRPVGSEPPALAGYARSIGLTPAERRVLAHLCRGLRPAQIAAEQGVSLSTVRTQIGHIRAKAGADSVRELMRRVALLPPVAAG